MPGPQRGYRGTVQERLSEKLELMVNGCWQWIGNTDWQGYAKIQFGDKPEYIHRISWILHNGCQIPKGMLIRHLCNNSRCANPEHLTLGTHKTNIHDRKLAQLAFSFPLFHY